MTQQSLRVHPTDHSPETTLPTKKEESLKPIGPIQTVYSAVLTQTKSRVGMSWELSVSGGKPSLFTSYTTKLILRVRSITLSDKILKIYAIRTPMQSFEHSQRKQKDSLILLLSLKNYQPTRQKPLILTRITEREKLSKKKVMQWSQLFFGRTSKS